MSASPALLPPAAPTPAARATRLAAVSSLLALIALALVWELWLAPLRPGGSWLALKAVPLLLPLSGLLRYRMFTYRWVALFVWLYFLEGVVRAVSDRAPSSGFALAEALLTLALFAACAAHVRLRQRQAKALQHDAAALPAA
ncbi:MAG: DUF2069 domain-containing protein [Desulfovibrionaceae bacterium]|jgi:uncharacterized membrane protein|nr:DUF2069 domain-containing protein [Desulfovibrionaceae bacterium]